MTKLLGLQEVCMRTMLSASTIYRYMDAKTFPNRIYIGSNRRIAWVESEVDQWIDQQVANSREKDGKK